MNVDTVFAIVDHHEKDFRDQQLYAGTYHWMGTEYSIMKGPTGIIAPFMSGWCSFLSRELMGFIVDKDWPHTVMVGNYGTTSDDANTGKWVQHAMQKHGIKVRLVGEKMITEIEKMKPQG
eukprot:m.71501 g.71501  ORF g.71501 m.71501 type:complete len:120 (-) comp10070_c0_seq4:66-425(-)